MAASEGVSQMVNVEPEKPSPAQVSQYVGDTKMGPVQPSEPPMLFPASAAPNPVTYTLAPCERDAWQFSVDQAHEVIAQCAGDAHTQAMGPFDGPYDAGTSQPGVPIYGMADHG